MDAQTPARPAPRAVPLLDAVERSIILGLYAWLAARIASAMAAGGSAVDGLLLVSEGLVVVFLLARRPPFELSRRPGDWLLAIAATCGPLLVSPGPARPMAPPMVTASLWLVGTVTQVAAKLALGRSLGCVAAHRGLKLGGPYRIVRHPMYAGYVLSHLAFLLMNPAPLNLLLYALSDGLQVPRMLAEERLLRRDPAYRAYCGAVRWRWLPGVF